MPQGKADQAVDILRSGSAQPGISGTDRGRLQIAMATVEAERGDWVGAQDPGHWASVLTHASAAKQAIQSEVPLSVDTEPELIKAQLKARSHVQLLGASWAVRALLAQGEDKDALDVANMQVKRSALHIPKTTSQHSVPHDIFQAVHERSLGLQLATAHATLSSLASNETATEAFTALQMHNSIYKPSGTKAPSTDKPTPTKPVLQTVEGVSLAGVHKAVADWHVHQGRGEIATAIYTQAQELAATAAAVSPGSSNNGGSNLLQGSFYLKEVEADALLGLAQQDILREDWPLAETRLAAAITAAEAGGSDAHPRLAPILTQLGWVYSRTARVTYAEGLFREAAKLMKLDPAKVTQLLHPLMEFSTDAAGKSASGEEREGSSSAEKGVDAGGDATAAAVLLRQQRLRKAAASATLVHPSLAALLCWRYCQLLTALPKREREADVWGRCAMMLWHCPRLASASTTLEALSDTEMERAFGSRGRLKGAGHSGSGVILSIATLRSLDGPL